MFTRSDCIFITHDDDCLIFHKNDEVLEDLIISSKNEFKLTDEDDLESFLGESLNKQGHNKLELTQPRLILKIIDTLGLQEE